MHCTGYVRAEDIGFEVGMVGGSSASLAVLGAPDLIVMTLTEFADQCRRMSRASGGTSSA